MTRHAKLTISLDASKFVAAMEQVGQKAQRASLAFAQVAAALSRAFGLAPKPQLVDLRRVHGLGNVAEDGTWLSDSCATWIHACPLPGACACRCHR
jgi:hypothetical protein